MAETVSPIEVIKRFRFDSYALLENLRKLKESMSPGAGARELSLAVTKLEEGRMWLGQALGALGNELPEEFQDKN